ncbi:MAG: hypothetical protein HY278_06680 [candidate division NC10 bacterium]|nr:hypothetical protein [candidate division NC10 bacterium]
MKRGYGYHRLGAVMAPRIGNWRITFPDRLVFAEMGAKAGGAIKHAGIVQADLNAKAACALGLSSVPLEGQVHVLRGGRPDVLPP